MEFIIFILCWYGTSTVPYSDLEWCGTGTVLVTLPYRTVRYGTLYCIGTDVIFNTVVFTHNVKSFFLALEM